MSKENDKIQRISQASFFKELGRFMKPYKFRYAASVVISIIGVVCELAVFVFVGKR